MTIELSADELEKEAQQLYEHIKRYCISRSKQAKRFSFVAYPAGSNKFVADTRDGVCFETTFRNPKDCFSPCFDITVYRAEDAAILSEIFFSDLGCTITIETKPQEPK